MEKNEEPKINQRIQKAYEEWLKYSIHENESE
jgi:hypothetical protein